jgi:hypothetical protein
LTRAILDTFPIVKFGTAQTPFDPNAPLEKGVNVQDPEASMEMGNLSSRKKYAAPTSHPELALNGSSATASGSASIPIEIISNTPSLDMDIHNISRSPSSGGSQSPIDNRQQSADVGEGSSRPILSTVTHSEHEDMVPASIGRETCPICIVDFEEGDDIRVLPCEGKHCFHQECVDPWLLKLSSSCPICRHGMSWKRLNFLIFFVL